MRLHLSLPAAALALCLAGCATTAAASDHGSTASSQATIVGTFRIIGGPYPGINRPLSGVIKIHVGSESGRVVAVTTAKAGHFTVAVPPGQYVAVGTSGSQSSLICTSGEAKTVHAQKTSRFAVSCDVP
jgi:hypothetical protein